MGVVGFIMGCGLALVLSTKRPDKVGAVVACYGIIPWADAQPDYSAMTAAALIHIGEKDDYFTPEAGEALAAAAARTGQGRGDPRLPGR